MSGLTSQTAYSQFITYQLAVAIGVIDKELEYDTAWAEAGVLYVDFCDSEFDNPNKSEYDAIVEYLENEKKKLDLLKAEEEAKKLQGERTITVSMNRNYSKYVEVQIKLPKSMTIEEVEDYLNNHKELHEDLEERLANKSLESGDSFTEYYDNFTFRGGNVRH